MKDKDPKPPRYWKPLVEHTSVEFVPPPPELLRAVMAQYDLDEVEALKWLMADGATSRFYLNDLYQVQATPSGPFLHLNIRRRDGGMFKDWRHFQMIKNEIAGEEREAVEVYPAESRKVDTSNKWHLWVLPEGQKVNVGWPERDVQYKEIKDVPGLRQRPL